MVKFLEQNKMQVYQCEECGLKYEEKEIAEKCEQWCREYKSCNLEIIKYAVPESEEHASDTSKDR